MRDARRVSDLMLERYRFGDVSGEEKELVEKELEADEELRSRFRAQEELYREARRRYPLERMEALAPFRDAEVPIGKGGAPARGRRLYRKKRILGLCAAALLCALFPSVLFLRGRSPGEWPEISGGPAVARGEMQAGLFVSLQTPDGPRPLFDQDRLSEGDRVQLEYAAGPGQGYGVIFSINGNAAVTLHYPRSGGAGTELATGGRIAVAGTYALDDAPDFEAFFFAASPSPLDVAAVLKTAGELAADPATAVEKSAAAFEGCGVTAVTIRK